MRKSIQSIATVLLLLGWFCDPVAAQRVTPIRRLDRRKPFGGRGAAGTI